MRHRRVAEWVADASVIDSYIVSHIQLLVLVLVLLFYCFFSFLLIHIN